MSRNDGKLLKVLSGRRLWWRRTILAATAAILAGLAATWLSGCYTNPATGKEQISLYSTSQEIQMGRQYHEQIMSQMGVLEDDAWQQYIQHLGEELAATSERPELPWTFTVLDDPAVNAFALPGGFLYVTRGMLYHCENEAELAGVVGHEIGHVTARHSVNQMSKQQLFSLGLLGGTLIDEDFMQKYGGLVGVGANLLFLKYSRDDEREADDLGLRYMYKANYNPEMMDDIFRVIDRMQESSGSSLPGWLSTHPAPSDRVERIEAAVAQLSGPFDSYKVNRDRYLQRLDGMVYGTDPREGYFDGSTFYHPQLRFRFEFPNGWQTVNQKEAVIGASPDQDAIMQITISGTASAAAAAQEFAGQEGITVTNQNTLTIGGLQAASVSFSAQTDNGEVRGNATFLRYNDNVFRIMGYGTPQGWSAASSAILGSIRTFGPVTDPARINVEPQRVVIVQISQSMTLSEFDSAYPSTVPIEELALINQMQSNDRFNAGARVKRVVGQGR